MRNFVFVAALMALGLASCTAEESPSLLWDGPHPPNVDSVLSVEALMSTTANGTATIDLWTPDVGYWVEPGLNHENINVICPSGRQMNLEEWRQEFNVSAERWGDGVLMFSSGNSSFLDTEAIPPCTSPCELEKESDGTWTCVC